MYQDPFATAVPGFELQRIVAEVMDIADIEEGSAAAPAQTGLLRFRGKLRTTPEAAYSHVAAGFQPLGYTPVLQHDRAGAALVAAPGTVGDTRSRLWLALLMFALTIASTIFIGGWSSGPDGATVYSIGLGLAFSAALLSILLAHELGHYIVARRLGVAVSYPFFIPMPFSPMGTMGAFIAMKEPPPDRRALLSIAIAGPLAGLVVAIPVLIIGLALSEVREMPQGQTLLLEGNSLLYAGLKILMFGRFLPDGAEDVLLHPVAFAGWAGLLVTGLNLIPAGQLDGGHILYALFGHQVARAVTWAMALGLIVMGFVWSGWFLWAVLIVLFGQHRAPLLNELTPLDRRMQALALLGLAIFVLIFTPTPLTVIAP